MKLRVIGRYVNRGTQYEAGTVIDVPEAEGRFLLADAPGCFSVLPNPPLHTEHREIDHSPVDRMMRGRRRK